MPTPTPTHDAVCKVLQESKRLAKEEKEGIRRYREHLIDVARTLRAYKQAGGKLGKCYAAAGISHETGAKYQALADVYGQLTEGELARLKREKTLLSPDAGKALRDGLARASKSPQEQRKDILRAARGQLSPREILKEYPGKLERRDWPSILGVSEEDDAAELARAAEAAPRPPAPSSPEDTPAGLVVRPAQYTPAGFWAAASRPDVLEAVAAAVRAGKKVIFEPGA